MKQLLHNEQIIMQYIWEMGDETPLRQLLIDINQRYDKDWKRTTIRTYLTQLQEKGLIELHTKGKYSYINALVSEDGYRENLTEQLVDEWYDGSTLDLVANLYKDEKLTEEDKQKLRRMLDELDDYCDNGQAGEIRSAEGSSNSSTMPKP